MPANGYEKLELFIDGEFRQGSEGKTEDVINPADESVLGELPHASKADLDEALAAWTRGQDAADLAERLQAAGVPAFPMVSPIDLLTDPDFAALNAADIDLSADAAAPVRDGALYVGAPWKLQRTPAALRAPTPNRGEHDDYVYGELLKLTPTERADLRDAGII